jgi:hypothetical protein
MAGRKPLVESDEPLVIFALKEFSLRNQALVLLGLNTGCRRGRLAHGDERKITQRGKLESLSDGVSTDQAKVAAALVQLLHNFVRTMIVGRESHRRFPMRDLAESGEYQPLKQVTAAFAGEICPIDRRWRVIRQHLGILEINLLTSAWFGSSIGTASQIPGWVLTGPEKTDKKLAA